MAAFAKALPFFLMPAVCFYVIVCRVTLITTLFPAWGGYLFIFHLSALLV